MNKEITEQYFICNGYQHITAQIDEISVSQPTLYEVIRVIDGIPLFLEDHMQRLEASAVSLNTSLDYVLPNIKSDITKLIDINNSPNKNIKLIVYNLHKETPDYIMCFVHSSYPTEELYQKGVHTILVHAERPNPNAKIINNELREMINQKLAANNAYEALLINNKGEITEGSRSNLFFVVENKVYTASADDILIGITRKYIIQACSNIGLELVEQPIPFSMLDYAEGAFITGTSPKVLPISTIEERELTSLSNPVVLGIAKEYDNILNEYIAARK